jgi:hypothetical protein
VPARNDDCEGPDPKAVSGLDCFVASLLAMTTRQPPRNDNLVSPLAGTTRHWIASLALAMTTPRTTRSHHSATSHPLSIIFYLYLGQG